MPPDSPDQLSDLPPPTAETIAVFASGVRAGLTSIFSLVIAATYVGVGAMSHDLGLSLTWSLVATFAIWAAPAHVILVAGLAGGASVVEIAAAVSLSAVRLVPMVVGVMPFLRANDTPLARLVLPVHLTSISTWIEGLRRLPALPRAQRIAYYNGLGMGMSSPALACCVLGYALAGSLPFALAAALLLLTPLVFLTSLARNARDLIDRLALGFGLVIGPALALSGVGLDLMWTGLLAGTAAYLIGRRQRPA